MKKLIVLFICIHISISQAIPVEGTWLKAKDGTKLVGVIGEIHVYTPSAKLAILNAGRSVLQCLETMESKGLEPIVILEAQPHVIEAVASSGHGPDEALKRSDMSTKDYIALGLAAQSRVQYEFADSRPPQEDALAQISLIRHMQDIQHGSTGTAYMVEVPTSFDTQDLIALGEYFSLISSYPKLIGKFKHISKTECHELQRRTREEINRVYNLYKDTSFQQKLLIAAMRKHGTGELATHVAFEEVHRPGYPVCDAGMLDRTIVAQQRSNVTIIIAGGEHTRPLIKLLQARGYKVIHDEPIIKYTRDSATGMTNATHSLQEMRESLARFFAVALDSSTAA